MANPLYPNVPIALGVPPVLRLVGRQDAPVPPIRSGSSQLESALFQWGIFDQGGEPIVDADNVAGVDDGKEYRIANYPLEQGSFLSYNKVATPAEIRIAMSKGGTLSDRQDFLKTLKSLQGDLKLYNVVTPEEVFTNMNIANVRKSRTQSNGATMITVEVTLVEIRIAPAASFSNSKSTSGASPVDNGPVQTTSFDTFPGFATIRDIK